MRVPSVWHPRYEYVPTLGKAGSEAGSEAGVGVGVADGVVVLDEVVEVPAIAE